MPRFSIIITTYNQRDLLPEIFRALDGQTFKDFDVHVCDDGSTDGTREYVMENKILEKLGGFTTFYHYQRNKGNFGANANQAIGKARGEYLVFIAADSMPELDYLEILDKYVAPDRVVCGMRVQIDKVGGKTTGVDIDWRFKKELVPQFPTVVKNEPWGRLTGNGLTVPAEAFRLYGKFMDNRGYGGEDNELIARLYYKGYLMWSVPDLRLYHRWHISKNAAPGNAAAFNKKITEYAS